MQGIRTAVSRLLITPAIASLFVATTSIEGAPDERRASTPVRGGAHAGDTWTVKLSSLHRAVLYNFGDSCTPSGPLGVTFSRRGDTARATTQGTTLTCYFAFDRAALLNFPPQRLESVSRDRVPITLRQCDGGAGCDLLLMLAGTTSSGVASLRVPGRITHRAGESLLTGQWEVTKP